MTGLAFDNPSVDQRSNGVTVDHDSSKILLAPQGKSGIPYVEYTLRTGAMLFVPTRAAVRRGGLALYNPQMLPGIIAKGLMRTGLLGRPVKISPSVLDDLKIVITRWLGHEQMECAFYVGAKGYFSKTVILAMDESGKPVAYAKLAITRTAEQAINREAMILNQLAGVKALEGQIPSVRGRDFWRNFPITFLSPGSSQRAPRTFGEIHTDFLARLQEATRSSGILLESPMWKEINRRLAAWRPRISGTWCERYDWALDELERCTNRKQLAFALAHGDFAPWNTRLAPNGALFVFDWEYAKHTRAIGWDLFYYYLALWAAKAHTLNDSDVAKLIFVAQRFRVEPARELLLAQLVDMALFYHELVFCNDCGIHHRMLDIAARGIDLLREAPK